MRWLTKDSIRITTRSLGGKLILFTALMLLLCLLLFMIASSLLFTIYAQHVTQNDANQRIVLMQNKYQAASSLLIQEAGTIAADARIVALLQGQTSQTTSATLAWFLLTHPHLQTMCVVAKNHATIGCLDKGQPTQQPNNPYWTMMTAQALQGYTPSSLWQAVPADTTIPSTAAQWVLQVAVPIGPSNAANGVLLIARQLNDVFAQTLVQGRNGEEALFCIDGHLFAGTSIESSIITNAYQQIPFLCTPGNTGTLTITQRYVTVARQVRAINQLATSPSLVLVAIEPVLLSNLSATRILLILLGTCLSVFSLGIVLYTTIAYRLFIFPLRQLDSHVRTMVVSNSTTEPVAVQTKDELSMLSRSFNLLSESLESENQAVIEQMSNVLVLTEALISTLKLEPLLSEIVSHLGRMMQVKNVSLLLYGREMPSPWAVAQWTDQGMPVERRIDTPAHLAAIPKGAVTVHADPSGDITMAATTKMAALPSFRTTRASGKREAVQNGKSSPLARQQTGPRIPRPALRDLDMILARLVIQRKRIAFGESIEDILMERREPWARMAFDAGYRSVIAVPLLLPDLAIGAFILYSDKPYQVSSRDMFLLSTAAFQASMAIQNALLFEEVNTKNAELERANQLKSQFLANVTHELRTPLHSIISYGAFLLDGFDGDLAKDQEEHVQFMVRSAEDLSHLVDDMLDLSKIEADRIEVKVESVYLEQSLQDVVSHLKPLADNKQLTLTLEIEGELPEVLADSHRLRQVLINLVSNALKFTEKGGVTISSTFMRRDDTVRIAVRDTGIGISPAALGYIFEAFRQADGSTTRRFGGTGLGLTIARKLIELQGGEVAVESVVGTGSTFSFTLPVARRAKGRLTAHMAPRREAAIGQNGNTPLPDV